MFFRIFFVFILLLSHTAFADEFFSCFQKPKFTEVGIHLCQMKQKENKCDQYRRALESKGQSVEFLSSCKSNESLMTQKTLISCGPIAALIAAQGAAGSFLSIIGVIATGAAGTALLAQALERSKQCYYNIPLKEERALEFNSSINKLEKTTVWA